ncbi:Trk system potassium transporter TrkA [Xanthovirga aplysinae]|uniref:Trk system potassium transporter TrkA n=1 Tax=Xanthovirga aplysinae TaxID=2529853 RepID=UPI0012BBC23F|nr:Trk system potassium transporter TrkA [Xanthovirga aplysinae]MTI32963.1 Trk system potassium transporter TrkA [Xanthovirga aplysinae]
MRIIIAGAGDVGFHLAKLLAYEKQNIVLIDTDPEKLKYVSDHLDVAVIRGNSTYHNVLEEAKVSKADLLIAATSSEETNIATTIIAKYLGARKTIARISNTSFRGPRERHDLKKLGIDELISPEQLAAKEIQRLLRRVALTDTFDFGNGTLSLIGVTIEPDSRLCGKSLEEIVSENLPQNYITVAILRGQETIIPHGKTRLQPNDHTYFIAPPEGIDQVLDFTEKEKGEIRNLMILGGSRIGTNTAKRLEEKYNIKLIEADKDKCFELADELPNTLVINGDGRDVDLLKEEGIEHMDAFIAVTGNSETNIISSLVAKNANVKKTIALVENIDYIHLSQNIGVDTLINKKLIAANFIFRYVRKGEIVSMTSIHGVDAEILEFEVPEGSKITKAPLRSLNLPSTSIIGGVIRKGVGYTTRGDFQFKAKDRVVVLAKKESIHKIEALFK